MKTAFFLFSLMLSCFSSPIFAQCNGQAKAVQTAWHGEKDIVGVAASAEQFSTLVAAVKAADLVSTLQSAGPFTVFAPTNAAFEKLPDGTVATLLKPENKATLSKILTYHVVAGEFEAADVVKAIQANKGRFKIPTVSGGTLIASLQDGKVMLMDEKGNYSNIFETDIAATNGVIHVLDAVVLPN